jgi:L-methionine (R)-S-oxide reductase
VYPDDPALLVLGPFQGHVACQSIRFGKGVCGTAAAEKEAQVVDDVDRFPGHIACDSNSKSEIVVPIVVNDQVIHPASPSSLTPKVVAIIDIDCAEPSGFGDEDRTALEKLADLLSKSCDFPLSIDCHEVASIWRTG